MENNNANVLIVDQDNFLLGLYANAFNNAGLNVEGAVNGRDGISILDNYQPDIIVMDIVFRDMSALQFLRHIYSNAEFRKVPIILVSNYNTDFYDEIAEQVGIYKRLMKFENTTDDILVNVFDALNLKI